MKKLSRLFKKLGKKVIFVLSAFVVAGAGIFVYSYFFSKSASAAWFDDRWAYRQTVALTNAGSNQTDYQISFTLDTSNTAKFQTDCDDIRITDTNGKLLPHWLEPTTCNTTTTKIWTKVPSITTSGATVYIYYGNPSATSVSSTGKTFIREITNVQGAWKLDETSDGSGAVTRNDSSGNGNNLTDINTTASTTGKFGNSGQFVRNNSERLEIADKATLSAGDIDFSIAQWVNLDTKTGFEIFTFKGTGGGADTTMEYVVRYNSSDRFQFIVGNGTTSGDVSANALGSPSTGTWYFIVAWHDSVANTINIQVNNGTVNSASYSGGSQDTGQKFSIGADHAALHHMDGKIDEVRFYKKVLTSDERTDLYNNFGYVTTNYANKELVRKRASTEPSAAAPSNEEQGKGPIAYWSFDDGQGSTAQDSTSSNYDGTITGATWQTEDKCIAGKCLFLTSTTDRVAAGTSNNLNITSGDATYQAWVRLTAATFLDNNTNWTLFSNESYQASGMIIRIDGGTGNLMYRSNQASASTNFTTTSTPITSNNTWYHIAAVKSGTTITFYVNGKLIQSGTITNPVTTANAFTIGSAVGGSQSVRGFMDDAKVYNFARTAAQILQDYNSGLANAGTNQGTSAVLGASTEKWLSDGLVGYWKMDESAANSCTGGVNDSCDSSGNVNDGAWNGTNIAAATGQYGNGISFNGSDDYVSRTLSPTISNSSFTISGWIKETNASADRTWLSVGTSGSTDNHLHLRATTAGVLRMGFYSNDLDTPASTFTTGTWHHVVYTYDSATGKRVIYLNGTQRATDTSSSAYTGDATLNIGRRATNSEYWLGSIDEVRIYNRALSSKEVSDLYNWAPGPVGYWKMDENTGQTAYDSSGKGYNATLGSGGGSDDYDPTWKTAKYGAGLDFGGSHYATVADNSDLDGDVTSFTVEAWAKFDSLGNYMSVISKYSSAAGGSAGWYLGKQYVSGSTYRPGFMIKDSSGNKVFVYSSTFTNYSTGTWYHITGVRDLGDDTIKFYVNGVLQNSITDTTTASIASDYNVYIGSNAFPTENIDGTIDDLKIYNYARTQKQIVEDMNAGHPAGGSPVGSAVGHWDFDEGYGTTANNSGSGGSTYNGTLTGSPTWTQSGKFGRAINFSPTDGDYVSGTAGFAASAGTVSAWFKQESTGATANYIIAHTSGANVNRVYLGTTSASSVIVCRLMTGTTIGSSYTVNLNQWYHAVCTWDGTNAKFYINGVQQGATTTITAFDSIGTMYVGSFTDGTQDFDGDIDEVKTYNYALTADEVKLDYNRGSSMVLGSTSDSTSGNQPQSAAAEYCIPGDTSTCTAPVGRWDFNEGTGSSTNDTSGNGNTGTITGASWSTGKVNSALDFGTNHQVTAGVGSSALNITGAMTVEAWVKTDSLPADNGSWVGVVSKGTTSAIWMLGIDTWAGTDKGYIFTLNGTTNYARATGASYNNNGRWTHIAGVYDGSYIKIYVNGQYITQTAYSSGITSNTEAIQIAKAYNWGSLDGKVDQVKIYNYARTPAQVAWDYNRGGPVGYWRLDECQGTTAQDSSGNGYSGTITPGSGGQTAVGTCTGSSGTMWKDGASGKRNYSLDFDGTDDYVSIGDKDILEPTTRGFSISAWAKATTWPAGIQVLVAKYTTQVSGEYYLGVYQNKGRGLIIGDPTNTSKITNSSSTLTDNQWAHLVMTWSGVSTDPILMYVNGKLDTATDTNGTITGFSATSEGTYLGARNVGATALFQGQIDDVKVFNYALTPVQVKDLYQGGAAFFGPSSGAP